MARFFWQLSKKLIYEKHFVFDRSNSIDRLAIGRFCL
jgi:hypothetical protein